ncbi:hypothetical protein ACGFI4_31345 [Micromonospora carbonacea]|uniref:hypothetical protein n=1 Tax=Micromonospora carbonacea TaxID=47853 RepID=UPI0037249B32
MNRYGAQAQKHWQTYLPQRYATIEDPNSFFSTLGEQAATAIEQRARELAGPDLPDEGYLGKLGRLNAAQRTAEEEILPELILIDPATDGPPDETPSASTMSAGPTWTPLVEDPNDPWWQRVAEEEDDQDDDPVTPTR